MHRTYSLGPNRGHVVIADFDATSRISEAIRPARMPRSGHIADTVTYVQEWCSYQALNLIKPDRTTLPYAQAQLYNLLASLRGRHGYIGDILDRYDRFTVQAVDRFSLREHLDRREVVFTCDGQEVHVHPFFVKTRLIPSFGRHMLNQGLAVVTFTSTTHHRSYKFPILLLDRG